MDKKRDRKPLHLLHAYNRRAESEAVQVDHMLGVVPAAQRLQTEVDGCMVGCDGDQEQSY